MSTNLAGRTALVTGAGRGIGREIATGLASAGARVALMSRTESELREVAAAIAAGGGIAETFVADVSDTEQLRDAVAQIGSSLGAVEVLINNAAVAFPLGPTETLAAAKIRAALEINVTAVIVLSGLVIPAMREAGWGRIVNVSSGVVATPAGMIGATVYAATKGALEIHTLNLAAELADTGIRVNAYRPGAVDTAMQTWIREQPPEAVGHALHDHFVAAHESGRLLSTEHSAARLLDRLATEDTGQIWSVHDR